MKGSRRYTVLVAGVAAALLVTGTNTTAATDERRVVPVTAAPGVAAAPAQVAARFVPVSPFRVLDTRDGTGTGGVIAPVGPGRTITLNLSTLPPAQAIPVTATSIVLNVTGTSPTAVTFVTVFPSGTTRPLASNLNLVPGQTRPNAVTVALGGDRSVDLYNNNGSTHLVADFAGYYDSAAGAGYTPRTPERVLDTRLGGGAVGPGGAITVDLTSRLPATATAVTFNLTGVDATANTFVTAWPSGAARPVASSLNLVPGEVAPNQVTVAIDPANRRVNLYNNAGFTHLIFDLAGFYTPGAGLSFFDLPPLRWIDTRPDNGLTPDILIEVGFDELPLEASAVVFNLTGTNPTGSTFVTVWPANFAEPLASNLNLVPGQTAPNLVTTPFGPGDFFDRAIWMANSQGYVDVVIDLAGYFAPAIS